MAWFITMCVLTYHSGAENRQFILVCRMECEHAVQFLLKAFFSAYKVNQTFNVVLCRPEILPSVTFTDVRSIFICLKVGDEITFIVTWLHE